MTVDYQPALDAFLTCARAAYPHEACGLIYVSRGKPRLFMCENVARDPLRDFVISAEQFPEAEGLGEVVGVVHSHPDGTAQPSGMDEAAHRASGLTWWIIGIPADGGAADMVCLPAAGPTPLVGRPFVHGVMDCFTLIRDWYAQERGIQLPDFEREDDWWHKGQNLYIENYARAGFVALPDGAETKPGDILLMNIGANVCNHGAVLVRDNVILHHLTGRLSCQEFYTSFYRDRTRLRLRLAHDPADGGARP